MKHFLLIALFGTIILPASMAQFNRAYFDSINQISQADHRQSMEMLGITELRPGPSGNPADPNAANSDESKATTYTALPQVLIFDSGTKLSAAEQWPARRKEITEHFNREIYGRLPDHLPAVQWKLVSIKDTLEGQQAVRLKTLQGIVDNSSYPDVEVIIDLTLGTPLKAEKAVPVIMEFGWNFPARFGRQAEGKSWKEMMLEQGWGFAVLVPTSVQADHGAGLREGIIGLVNKGEPRKPDDWGALRAWAWGASKAMDYFETDRDVDATRVGIEGLSRYGKAAIVCMAYDERFAIGFIGSSGAGGAKILRRTFGEQVENLASSAEYHWFAPNFIKYAGPLTPNDLPVDAHQLVALCAPRPVFISVGSPTVEGQWIDAKGMFLAALHAGPAYRLLGKETLSCSEFPPQETNCAEGEVAYRQHEGGHTVTPNWPFFIEFAKRYF